MTKQRKIPSERKFMFYFGYILIFLGIITFILSFIDQNQQFNDNFNNFGNLRNFGKPAQSIDSGFTYAIIGFVMMFIGVFLNNLGRKGLAGSGLILDMKQEKEDLEPINRMIGGQINDVLDEVKIDKHFTKEIPTIIKIKCQHCKHLNEESAKFCNECGKKI